MLRLTYSQVLAVVRSIESTCPDDQLSASQDRVYSTLLDFVNSVSPGTYATQFEIPWDNPEILDWLEGMMNAG